MISVLDGVDAGDRNQTGPKTAADEGAQKSLTKNILWLTNSEYDRLIIVL